MINYIWLMSLKEEKLKIWKNNCNKPKLRYNFRMIIMNKK